MQVLAWHPKQAITLISVDDTIHWRIYIYIYIYINNLPDLR